MATQQEYDEQDQLVQKNTAIVQPWLKDFAKDKPEIGTSFYTDVTILSGPHSNYFWNDPHGKELRERHHTKGDISIYYVKGAGASFIIEYKFDGNAIYKTKTGVLFRGPHYTPINSYFLYKGQQYPVPMEIATAAGDLYKAQEYRGVLWGLLSKQKA